MTDKDYAAMKAGKKTLETIQKEKGVGKEIQGTQKAIQLPNKPIPIGKTGVKLDPSQLATLGKLFEILLGILIWWTFCLNTSYRQT